MPFVYFAAPLVFIAGYVVIVNFWLKGASRAWSTHAIVGGGAWAALGGLLMISLITDPPFTDPALNARAWIVTGGFTLYLGLIGASAGLLCRLLAGETRQAAPAGASVDLNRPL